MTAATGNRCRYTGVSELEQKSTLVEYEADQSDASGKKMKKSKESSGSTRAKLTVTFDVYETNITGCQADTIAWAINVSSCVSGDLESTGNVDGESTPDDTEQVCASVRTHILFLIAGGLYSVTALRENDQERVTLYTKHRLTLQLLLFIALCPSVECSIAPRQTTIPLLYLTLRLHAPRRYRTTGRRIT